MIKTFLLRNNFFLLKSKANLVEFLINDVYSGQKALGLMKEYESKMIGNNKSSPKIRKDL
jgi:hypothetical protein